LKKFSIGKKIGVSFNVDGLLVISGDANEIGNKKNSCKCIKW